MPSSPRSPSTNSSPRSTPTNSSSDSTRRKPQHDAAALRDTIVSLNNSAIELLQRGSCRCSVDTFKDALALMKSTTDPSSMALALELAEQRKAASASASAVDGQLVVLESHHDPEDAYNLLARVRTSKVCLTLNAEREPLLVQNNNDDGNAQLLRSILVYNYGIAHRCCGDDPKSNNNNNNNTENNHSDGNNNNNNNNGNNGLRSFCLQIFQYSESLLPPALATPGTLLFRLVLTRNLMMLSCRLGMTLCEHYKETLDPIVEEIVGPVQPAVDSGGKAPAA